MSGATKVVLCAAAHFVLLLALLGVFERHSTRPRLDDYLRDQCAPLKHVYDGLLDESFSLWYPSGFSVNLLEHTSSDRVQLHEGLLRLSESTAMIRTIPTFVSYIEKMARTVKLPDMLLPLNPADEPLAKIRSEEPPRPLLGFCKWPGFSDVLIPNTAEGEALYMWISQAYSVSKVDLVTIMSVGILELYS